MSSQEIQNLKENLQCIYRIEFANIKTFPLDAESDRSKEEIYVDLVLLNERNNDNFETIDYDKLFEILHDEQGKARISIVGEAGVGKTTLLGKIAYDWATGKRLQDIDLLFFVRLHEINKSTHFSKMFREKRSDGFTFDNQKLRDYMRRNQRKIVLLLDGLDEYRGDIQASDSNDFFIHIIRGHKLKHVPVIVTTRPWRAGVITRGELKKKYIRLRIDGFQKSDITAYITKFFRNDAESAKSLIHLATEESKVAQTMVSHPLFCSMLCHMWKFMKAATLERVRKMKTYSEVIGEVIYFLVDQYVLKMSDKGEISIDYNKRCENSLLEIGKVAFRGLLEKQFEFDDDAFKKCIVAKETGYKIGILSSKSTVVSQKGQPVICTQISFSHKLLQEYLAGLYLASLYHVNRKMFKRLLREKVLTEPRQYEYLLYFTAAQSKGSCDTAQPLIEFLCNSLAIKRNVVSECETLIVDIALEYNDEERMSLILYMFLQTTRLRLNGQDINWHTFLGYMFLLGAIGHKEVRITFTWS